MRQIPLRAALTLLVALLCLSACQAAAGQAQTATPTAPTLATTPPLPTATTMPAPAPTPTNVPAGWTVMTGLHFSMAYPPNWTRQSIQSNDGALIYTFMPPHPQNEGVTVSVYVPQGTPQSANLAPYCLPPSSDVRDTTFAGLPMVYMVAGEGLFMRTWTFVNALGTMYSLDALDAQGSAAAQAQDAAMLSTFRPDSSTPWRC